jgi:sugar phosphate isomerase/epimerase
MPAMSRSEFVVKDTAAGAASAGVLSARVQDVRANPLGIPIGCQTYPVRKLISQDFPGTLKQLADAGFQTIELCSPVGYADSGFGEIAKYKGSELRKLFGALGLTCVSSHFSLKELRDDLRGRIAWAQDVGLTQMFVATLDGPRTPTMDDVKKAADEYNQIAAQVAEAGIQLGLHNENFEMTTIDGMRTYDILFDVLDPKLMKFQFQISTISRGFDSIDYFTRYPGRFNSMHVQGWSADTQKIVAVGDGTLDWKKIFTAAKVGGIKDYFVEMDLDLMRASVPYLRSLQV